MRLVQKHADVGYQTPGQRPGCRNCAHAEEYRPESGICYNAPRLTCTKHVLEITSGGICRDHQMYRKVSEAERAYRDRQLFLYSTSLDELLSPAPQNGEFHA